MRHQLVPVIVFLISACSGQGQQAGDNKESERSSKHSEGTDYFVDERDGQKYRTVKIGDHIWTAQNLNFKTYDSSWCLYDEPINCNMYGRLYSFNSAISACPKGWHLPSKEEFEALIEHYQGYENAGQAFTKDDSLGLQILLGGWRSFKGQYANYHDTGIWTSTSTDNDLAYGMTVWKDQVSMANDIGKKCGYYVRLVKNK